MSQFYIQKSVIHNKNYSIVKIIAIFVYVNYSLPNNYQIIARSNTAKKPDNFLAFFFLQPHR